MKPYELTDEIIEDIRDRWALRPNIAEKEIAHEAQKKLLEWLDKQVHYTDDNEIGTGDDKNIMICLSPKQWQSLLKDFGIKDA